MIFSNLEAVLFDLDGTLIDCSDIICASFNSALRKEGMDPLPTDTVKRMIGRPLRELFTELKPGGPVKPLIEGYKAAFRELSPGNSRLLPGARELLGALSERRQLGIVTSRSSSGTAAILQELGVRGLFRTLVGVEDVVEAKPCPAPVIYALEQLGVEAARAIFVGDTPYDMESGRRAGTRTIGVTTGAFEREQLLEAGADLVVDSLWDLKPLVEA
jgi:HAD superfamily hydrolase (TIGR01509 family)